MKVIFLDMDGVLNSLNWAIYMKDNLRCTNHGYRVLDPLCVQRLNKIIEETGAKLVLSSSWRALYKIDAFNELMNRQGAPSVIDYTQPKICPPRGKEIQGWLDGTKETIESFVILDDDDDMEHLADRLVLCNYRDGLQDEQVNKTIGLLNG